MLAVADPKLEFLTERMVRRRRPVSAIVLHHEAGNAGVWGVHAYHRRLGWAGIGYHYYVDRSGAIWSGRPEEYVGAHCAGHNADTIGICCAGNMDKQTLEPDQYVALLELLTYLVRRYPGVKILRHKDLGATSCPGKHFPIGP